MAPTRPNTVRRFVSEDVELLDLEPDTHTLLADVLDGLSQQQKTLPCKYFYDERGAKLFEMICDLEEYYPTRTELRILQDNLPEIADHIGSNCAVIEPGSGSGIKTRLLLEQLEMPSAYIPIDVAKEQLLDYAKTLSSDYPDLEVLPVCADFTASHPLPKPNQTTEHQLIYFPGSTIGNFSPDKAVELLTQWRELLGDNGSLLIGVDLKKDRSTLESAYNDAEGITADFNLNLLKRLNRELDADFNLSNFRHHADYDEDTGAIRMWLISEEKQTVKINDSAEVTFDANEAICTEHSHKYSIDDFSELSKKAGWQKNEIWLDKNRLFSLWHLETA